MYFILFYSYVENIIERRIPYREEHLSLAKACVERGELILGGAFAEPIDGAAIVFHVETKEAVEAFVAKDPYVTNGLVTQWHIRQWNAVIGSALQTL